LGEPGLILALWAAGALLALLSAFLGRSSFFSERCNDGEVPAKAIAIQSLWVSALIISGTF
jgi:hypothetical protein